MLVRDCNCQSNSGNCRKVNIGRLLQETSRGMQAGHRFNLSEHATGADVELAFGPASAIARKSLT